MNILFTTEAWTDYRHWQNSNQQMAARINRLIEDIQRTPFTGLGMPEPLRRNLSGWWSRRLSSEHRLVYRIVGAGAAQRMEIMSCRFHYR
jgi:toxin YoeB